MSDNGPPPFALRDYAFLADGERGVLIGPRGEMAWTCYPAWGSPSVDDHWWAHSRLICAGRLRRVAAFAPKPEAGRWTALAEAITAETPRTGTHPSGRWQGAADDHRVDAALLFPVLRGGVGTDDPRTEAALSAIEGELGQDGYLYRSGHGERRPLEACEGAFSLCGFALALTYHERRQRDRATTWFERNGGAMTLRELVQSADQHWQSRELRNGYDLRQDRFSLLYGNPGITSTAISFTKARLGAELRVGDRHYGQQAEAIVTVA